MASRKAEAIKKAKLEAEQKARWDRLEQLVLAIAEAAGIDVDAVLMSVGGEIKEVVEEEPSEIGDYDITKEALELAEANRVPLDEVEASGANGRILKKDIEAYLA